MIIYHKTTSMIAWQKEVCFSKLLLHDVLAFANQNNDWNSWSQTPPQLMDMPTRDVKQRHSDVKTSREQRQNILAGLELFSHTDQLAKLGRFIISYFLQ